MNIARHAPGLAMEDTTVVVLGGGVGGLVASNVLREKLGNRAAVKLVERKRHFQFPPSYPWLMLGSRKPEQVSRALSLLKKKGIEVENDEVVSLDVEKKSVNTRDSRVAYDYLIVSLG